jgi:hypothetical protein
VLKDLLNEAVTFFKDPKSRNVDTALEKIANSLERVKTILYTNNKKESTISTIKLLSNDAEIRKILETHLKSLNWICNNYKIRHKETGQKSLDSEDLKEFLFYEYYNIIRFILQKLDREESIHGT